MISFGRTAAALAMALYTCSAFAADDEAKRARFINGVPNSAGVTVNVGGKALWNDVSSGKISEYKSVIGDDPKIEVIGAGGSAGQTADLGNANENYTIVASPNADGTPKLSVFTLPRINPNDPKAQITLINASSDVKAADLIVGDDKVHAGVNPAGHNGPDKVDAGSKMIKVRDGSQDKDLFTKQMDFQPGKSYTVVIFSSSQVEAVDDSAGARDSRPAATLPVNKDASPKTDAEPKTAPAQPSNM